MQLFSNTFELFTVYILNPPKIHDDNVKRFKSQRGDKPTHTHTPAKQTLLKQYPIRYAIAAREVVNNNQQETINELV